MITSITSIKASAGLAVAGISTAISTLLGVNMDLMKILIVLMVADYATGLVVAGVFGESKKSANGTLESKQSVEGLFRKCGMLLCVGIALMVDMMIGTGYIAMTTIYFFISNEVISLVENLGLMGVPMPDALSNAIEILKKKGEGGK